MDNLKRKICRYRAFAYHHRKKRVRKKYLKKLLDIERSLILMGGKWEYESGAVFFTDSARNGFQTVRIPGTETIKVKR